jgi:hypothetical protein
MGMKNILLVGMLCMASTMAQAIIITVHVYNCGASKDVCNQGGIEELKLVTPTNGQEQPLRKVVGKQSFYIRSDSFVINSAESNPKTVNPVGAENVRNGDVFAVFAHAKTRGFKTLAKLVNGRWQVVSQR